MKPIRSAAALLVAASVMAACAMPGTAAPAPGHSDPSPRAESSLRSARASADRIPLYADAALSCPVADLGRVEGRTIRDVRRQARVRGADAVLDLRTERSVEPRLFRSAQYQGRAVRFEDANCRR
jgi:hypothetical protein